MIGYKESLLKPLGYNNTLGCTLDERGTTLHEVLHTKQTFLLPTVETQNNYSNNKAKWYTIFDVTWISAIIWQKFSKCNPFYSNNLFSLENTKLKIMLFFLVDTVESSCPHAHMYADTVWEQSHNYSNRTFKVCRISTTLNYNHACEYYCA